MNKMSLKVKLAVGFGVLLVIIAVMALVSYTSINKLSDLSNEVDKQLVKKQFSIELDSGVELQTSSTRGFLLSGNEGLLKRRDQGIAQFNDRAGELSKLLQTERGKAVMEHIKAEAQEVQSAQGHAIELRRSGKKDEAFKAIFNDHTSQVRVDLEKSIDDLIALIQKLQDTAQTEHEQVEASTFRLVVILACASLLIGLAVAVLIVRSITGAISRMLGLIQEIVAKNLAVSDLQITSEDEIGKAGIALNEMKNSLHGVIRVIAETALHVTSASEELSATSRQISANSEETSAQASTVSSAAQQVNENLHSVATGAEEMTATIQSIASNAQEAAKVAGNAVKTAEQTNATVAKLGESSAEIGQVIKVITSIAQQTNLLALNAAIEAARAGEAGKGFAVVANEVKELAKQTAKATEDISQKITAIQGDTKGAVEAIGTITGVISQINDISSTIATAVEEQSATTNEMSRNVTEAAKGSGEITQNIQGVAEAARGTSSSAQESQKASNELAELAGQLRKLVEQFKIEGGSGADRSGHSMTKAASAGR